MCAAMFNGCAEEAACGASVAPVMASGTPDCTEIDSVTLAKLETGTVLTIFHQKKSQRPERKTFKIRRDTRQIVWYRSAEKIEGEGECWSSDEWRCGACGNYGMR